jgi:ATP-dependent DNA helicase RecG
MPVVISETEALAILDRREGQFWDDKSGRAGGKKVQKLACALANADGGEF